MTAAIILLLIIVPISIAAAVVVLAHSQHSAVEMTLDDARAADGWPSEDDLLDAFAADIENADEADLRRLSGRLSTLRARMEALARTTPEEKHHAR
jgi:hypothetical protein